MDFARIARGLYEQSWGRIRPQDLQDATYDQLIIMWSGVPTATSITAQEAISAGLIDPRDKTGVELAKERAAAKRAEAAKQTKRRRRGNG